MTPVIADKYYQSAFESKTAISWHDPRSFFTEKNLLDWQKKVAQYPNYDFKKLTVEDMYFAVASGYMSKPEIKEQILTSAKALILNPKNDLDRAIPKPILGALAQREELTTLIDQKITNANGRMMRYSRLDLALLSAPNSKHQQELLKSYEGQLELDKRIPRRDFLKFPMTLKTN